MRVLHSSDLHGRYKPLLRAMAAEDFDLWIDTGDFLPNPNRNRSGHDWHQTNRIHQLRWLRFKSLAGRIADALGDRPAIVVGGNHDFIPLGTALRHAGVAAIALKAGISVEHGGLRFAGFPEVVRHHGRWAGEIEQAAFAPIVEATFATDPDVLCTHSPPYGVLDEVDPAVETDDAHIGVEALARRLAAGGHRVRWHLFGHVHETADREVDRDGVRYRNGALTLRVIELG